MNYIECTVGVAMAAFLAMVEARGDEATVTLPEIVVTAIPTDLGRAGWSDWNPRNPRE
ncbi:MAG: hypothetical protein M3495_20360 [Pseudomonadota bacterium]|nr:hypothetical protein [Gammaproteobacteria bacterium]MDQ3583803.1 hypothetical protein [Pseudomonadota bacterium]